MMKNFKRVLVACSLMMATTMPTATRAQGVQAIQSLRASNIDRANDAATELRRRLAVWRGDRAALAASTAGAADVVNLNELISLGDYALGLRNDPRQFAGALQAVYSNAERVVGLLRSPGGFLRTQALEENYHTDAMGATVLPPQMFKYVPDVVFVVSYGNEFGDGRGGALSLASNLLGELGSAAFDLVEVKPIADYMKTNVSVGATFPTRKAGKIGLDVSLGLGEWKTWGASIWPVVGMTQLDSTDAAIPASVTAADSTAKQWSSPYLALGFAFKGAEWFKKRVNEGKVVPVISVGARLPHYYAGSAYRGLSALWSGRFTRVDEPLVWFVTVSFPILKVKTSE